MKQWNPFPRPENHGVKSLLKKMALPLMVSCLLFPTVMSAQCGAGYSQVTLDWDNLDYFSYTGNYTVANGYLASNALSRAQIFSFGTQRLSITHNFADANEQGEDVTHTGDAGSNGIGSADVHFLGNGRIILTFDNEVQGLKFSMFDVDRSQRVAFAATNALGIPQNVTVTPLGTTILTPFLNGTALTTITASTATVANNSNNASFNVDIAGPVRSLTLTITNTATNGSEDGSFWLSNIIACSAGAFPNTYFNVSRPYTNQAGYVLHSFDRSVYAVNPVNGVTKLLFTDATNPYGGSGFINSMGYDPYNRILYYVYSLTGSPASNRLLKKYDFNTKTISTVLSDISSATYGTGVNIPVSTGGVESGAAAFYNGSYYLGIETSNAGRNSSRETVIWRIDFDGSNVPYRACQVFATPIDNGAGTLLHDWADFTVDRGMLYDFDGAGVTTQTDIYQVNLMTAATTNYTLPATYTPGQPTVDWNGNLYQLYASTAGPVIPYVALYNPGTGTIGTRTNLTSTPAYTPAAPSLGDAAEGFRPLADFGDAPASFDPVAGDPAVHEIDPNLRLGAAESDEFITRGQTPLANSDNNEDGLGAAPPLLNFAGIVTYTVSNISVFNNTGGNATLIGWLDYNMNGIFEAGEGRTTAVPIPTSATAQLVNLTWTNILVPSSAALRTYLRLRLTRTVNGMVTSDMVGYMPDGEVEDYPVTLGINLPVEITGFDVQKGNGKTAMLDWTTTGNMADNAAFEIERSADGQQWQKAGTVNTAIMQVTTNRFTYKDENALAGKSYYRIKTISKDGTYKYTIIKSIAFSFLKGKITVSPNPVTDFITVQLSSERAASLKVMLFDYAGKTMYEKNMAIAAGDNTIRLTDIKSPAPGMYYIKLNLGEEVFTEKLIVAKN